MTETTGNITLPESSQSNADLRIPTLQAVLDPNELVGYLYPILPSHWGVLRDIRINLQQRPHRRRCTLEISLETTTGRHSLIGKVYAEDRWDVYRAMKLISESGFGPDVQFSIPQPFAFIPELNLLLQEKVQGPLATETFLTGTEDERTRAAERCACWLAHFHMRAPISGRAFSLTHDLMEHWMHHKPLEHWKRRIAKRAGPSAAQLIDKTVLLFERLGFAAVKHDRLEMRACHGAYCHYQIIFNESRTVTLDWDSFCIAHPSLDVARFIIILKQLALNSQGSLRALDAVNEVFYKTYVATSGFEVEKHLGFYQAAHCLKHSKDYLKRENARPEMAEMMVDEGLRTLSEEM